MRLHPVKHPQHLGAGLGGNPFKQALLGAMTPPQGPQGNPLSNNREEQSEVGLPVKGVPALPGLKGYK